MAPGERWRSRGATLEALALVILARLLVACVPLAKWRRSLGHPTPPEAVDTHAHTDTNLPARRISRAVQRASARLPGQTKCLPQAMAVQWMLRRRGLGGTLVVGVRSGSTRGGVDDLHAWVVRAGRGSGPAGRGAACAAWPAA